MYLLKCTINHHEILLLIYWIQICISNTSGTGTFVVLFPFKMMMKYCWLLLLAVLCNAQQRLQLNEEFFNPKTKDIEFVLTVPLPADGIVLSLFAEYGGNKEVVGLCADTTQISTNTYDPCANARWKPTRSNNQLWLPAFQKTSGNLLILMHHSLSQILIL
jgi:hypothetical protein